MLKSVYGKFLLVLLCCNAFSISLFAQWTTASMSTARFPAGASAGTKAFFAGGGNVSGTPSDVVDIYDVSSGMWTATTMPHAMSDLSGASLGNRVYFAGGLDGVSSLSDHVQIYDITLSGWLLETLSEPRTGIASASAGGKVLFGGGFLAISASNVVDIYDSNTDTWDNHILSAPRAELAAAGAGSKVLFAGGYDLDMSFEVVYSNVVDIYDTGTDMWTTATLSQARGYVAGAAVGTKIMFAGGIYPPFEYSDVVDIYDTGTGTWTTATLSQARSDISATTVGTKIIFAGGTSASGYSDVVDIYDNSTGTWSTSTISVARALMGATSIGSKALFGGGYDGNNVSLVDIFDAGCNPTLTVTPPSASLCTGGSIGLTASGGSNYIWSPAAGLNQTTGASVIASPTTTTTYLVLDPGLAACASVTVTVGSAISFTTVSPQQTICNGSSTRLFTTGLPTVTWSPSTGLSATTGVEVIASPTVTTTYTVTGSNGTGCFATADITVVVSSCSGLTTEQLSQKRFDLGAATVGSKAIFAGGTVFGPSQDLSPTNYASNVDIYDNSTGVWSSASLSRARTELAATTVGSKAMFAGGRHEGGAGVTSSSVVDVYDNSTGMWTVQALSEARHLVAATSTSTKAYFAGGFSFENGYTGLVDIYDNSTGMWTTASLTVARANVAAAVVGTKVFFAGGVGPSGVSDVVDIYDESTDTWSTASLTIARKAIASATLGTKVYFAGGRMAGDVPTPLIDVYDNSTDTWGTAMLSEPRDFLAAGSAGNQVYFGGGDIGDDVTNTIDIYDSDTDTWTTAVLSADRSNLAAASAGSKFIFAGGLGLNANDGLVIDILDFVCLGNQVTVSADVAICPGGSTLLTASGAVNYTWSPSTGLSSTTDPSVTASPTSTTTYIVSGDHGSGCITQESVTVTVRTPPTVNVTADHSICIGASTNLTATGALTYSWSPATYLSGTTGATVTSTPTATITYTVVGTDGNGCTDPATVTVTVNPLPTVTVSPPTTICQGTSTILTASGASTYIWSPATGLSATTGTSVTATPPSTITYTVTGIDANGCLDDATVMITVNPAPNVTVTPSPSVCAGNSTILTASGAVSYTWSPATGLSGTTGPTVTATPATTTTYTVTGTDAIGCSANANTTVTVYHDIVDVTPSMTICAGDVRTLTATGADTYTWSPATGLSATTGSSVLANPTSTITYTVDGTYGPGCTGQATLTITVNQPPIVAVAPATTTICAGQSVTLNASNADTYSWAPFTLLSSGTGPTVTAGPLTTSITYTVTGTDANGCTDNATVDITVNPLPPKPDITISAGAPGILVLESSATTGNQWYLNGVVVVGQTSQTIEVSAATEGVYTVITTQGGCPSPLSDPESAFITALESIGGSLGIYPNPATETLYVQWESPGFDHEINVSIVDPAGRAVIRQQLPSSGGNVSVSDLSPGLYLLQASKGGSTKAQRFVKK